MRILDRTVQARRPGCYQLQAAIAACHAAVADAADTDWAQIALLYAALACWDPSPVIHANRAVAVAMADGPAAGLAVLDQYCGAGADCGWHLLHACRCLPESAGTAAAACRAAAAFRPAR